MTELQQSKTNGTIAPLDVKDGEYQLTPKERQTVTQVIHFEHSVKARLLDLQSQMEALRQEVLAASAQRRGVVAMLIQSRGWEDGALSEDFSTLTKRG